MDDIYKILMVDDNALIRMSLINIIQWDKLNAEVVAMAHDGEEGFRLCEELQPDIVITDIKMPIKDGLYLMKQLHTYYPSVQIIVVSAYGEFEYAKQAMQAGCLNYLLKPIDARELNESIHEAIRNIQKKRLLGNVNLYDFYEQIQNSFPDLEERFKVCFLVGKKLPLKEKMEKNFLLAEGEKIFQMQNNEVEVFVFLLEKKHAEKFVNDFSCELTEKKYLFAWGELLESWDILRVNREYKKVLERAAIKAFWVDGKTEQKSINVVEMETDTRLYWASADNTGMLHVLRCCLVEGEADDYKKMNFNKEVIMEYLRLLAQLSRGRFDDICHLLVDIERQEQDFCYMSINSIMQDIRQLLILMCEDVIKGKSGSKKLALQIRKIIDINYMLNINLSLLASLVSYSEAYISRVFKKEMGINVNQYLTEVRLGKAAELLKKTNMKIGEIAEKVGYNNYFHFTKRFRKKYGKAPLEYRNDCLEEKSEKQKYT